jgi:hypothetical protein
MSRFFFAVSVVLLLSFHRACAAADSVASPVSELSEVVAHPREFDGRNFLGYVYVYGWGDYYVFYPNPVDNDHEADAFLQKNNIVILPGTGASIPHAYARGARLFIRGRISLDLKCFEGYTCTPFDRPVFINDLQILKMQ